MKNETKLAAAYVRVSTDDQTDLSPDTQLEKIREYAQKNDMLLLPDSVFYDEGISGRKAESRPGFQNMIAKAKDPSHPFDVILVWKFSRFARNQEESIFYKSVLRSKCNVDVVSVSEPLIAGPFGSLIERIIEWMDEFYSIRLSEEVKRSMTVNAKNGVLQSTPSFGYKVENRTLVPVDAEAQIVRELFRRFAAGDNFSSLAKWCNEQGVRTHRGNKFENRTVEYILRNPVYIGKLRWNPTGRTRRDFNNENIILADASHEPLIEKELWDIVQRRIAEQKAKWPYKGKPSYDRKHWLCGIVRCKNCGSTLIFAKPHYFKCNNYVRGSCRSSQHIDVALLEEAFVSRLRLDSNYAEDLVLDRLALRAASDNDRAPIMRRIDRLRAKLERVKDAYAAGVDTLEEYKAAKTAITAELADAQAQLNSHTSESVTSAADDLRQAILNTLTLIEDENATVGQKYDALLSIIDRCEFDKNSETLSITYRLIV